MDRNYFRGYLPVRKSLDYVYESLKLYDEISNKQGIARQIKNSSESESWEEFELRFKQVHGDFYETLIEKYPDLTASEQKLCAFLKLNMTSKDISELTGQSPASLQKARYRLRKKLDLPDSQTSLVSFLSKL